MRCAGLLEAVDRDDVRVVQGGQDLGLTLEAGESLGSSRDRLREHLDRDVAIELGVAGAVHLAHPARAQRREDLVRPDLVPVAISEFAVEHCLPDVGVGQLLEDVDGAGPSSARVKWIAADHGGQSEHHLLVGRVDHPEEGSRRCRAAAGKPAGSRHRFPESFEPS